MKSKKVKPPVKKKAPKEDKLIRENALLISRAVDLQKEIDALKVSANAGKHDKLGRCRHCGRVKIDHFFRDNRCRPNGHLGFEEVLCL